MIHTFRFQDLNVVLDVESGAVHLLDDGAFAVLSALERGQDPYTACSLANAEIEEILSEYASLKAQGLIDRDELEAPPVRGGSAIKSLCLHVAHDCNLRCKYCFASTGDFHGARMMMPFSIGKASIDFLMEHSGGRKHLEVDLFGGEPLMNFDVCKQIVAYGREQEARFGKKINFTMTTNCVALDDEKIAFINREMHNVVISLDGRREIHDALRPTVNEKGSYDIILEKARKLVENRGAGEHYIRGTFTRNNLDFTEDVKALLDEGFRQLSLEPVVLPSDSPYSILEEHLGRVFAEYDALAAYYLRERKHGRWFNFFHFMIDMEGGPCLRKRISGCGAGTEYAAITPDGDIYPCHQFVGIPDWKLGNVCDHTFDTTKQSVFEDCNVRTKPACRDCWAKYYCSGGCAANAFLYNGDICKPYEMSCQMLRKRTECALGISLSEHAATDTSTRDSRVLPEASAT